MPVPTSMYLPRLNHKGPLKLDKIWEWPPKFMFWNFQTWGSDIERGGTIKSRGLAEGDKVAEVGLLEGVDAYSR